MRQITKFEELPEELREHPFYDREQAWIACYNTGLSDGGKRPPLTEVPEHVLKALANVAGAWDIKQILAALNADRAGEQPVKTPAPAAAAEPKNICEKCHGEGWYNPLDGGDCVNCQECGGTGKAASPQVIHMPKYAGKPRLDTSCPAPASEPKELKQIATMLATPFHDLVALVSPAPAAEPLTDEMVAEVLADIILAHESGDDNHAIRRLRSIAGSTPAPAADMQQLRNVAAWAVHHHAYGGIHDSKSILKGNADRRIKEAAAGDLGKSAPDPEQDCKCPVCSPAPAADAGMVDARCDKCGKAHFDGDCKLDPTYADRHVVADQAGEIDSMYVRASDFLVTVTRLKEFDSITATENEATLKLAMDTMLSELIAALRKRVEGKKS